MLICFLCYSIYLFTKFHCESVYSTDSYNETFYFKDGFGYYNCYVASTLQTHSIRGDFFSGKSSLKMFTGEGGVVVVGRILSAPTRQARANTVNDA